VERVMTAESGSRRWRPRNARWRCPSRARGGSRRDPPAPARRDRPRFKTADGWTLIDYKTDQLGPGVDQLAERYAPQIRAYADHWSAQPAHHAGRAAFHPQRGNALALDCMSRSTSAQLRRTILEVRVSAHCGAARRD